MRSVLRLLISLFFAAQVSAAADHGDLTQLSLEELMTLEITSVAKKQQHLTEAAAAIYVITSDDIRRSGATSLPEVLRLAPGVSVARIDGNKWSVSIRGFSGRFSDKLLVLLDGRTLYSSVFSGIYWEVQDVLLEDVERIEVIRGPGGTLWGANAVNGVINIITRRAGETQGTYLQAEAGNLDQGVAARFGAPLGQNGHFRLYAKYDHRADLETASGQAAHDAWDQRRLGFRADLNPTTGDRLSIQGDFYAIDAEQRQLETRLIPPRTAFVPDRASDQGGNLLMRWQRRLSEREEWQWQVFLDHSQQLNSWFDQHIDTYDMEFQHRLSWSRQHELTWGLGYRHTIDRLDGTFTVSFIPRASETDLLNLFLQDEWQPREDLRLTLGAKVEHNDFSGFELQPNLRLLWQATPTDTWWGAVSRAVRTPSRADQDILLNFLVAPTTPPMVVQTRGNPGFDSEEVLAFESGYRSRFGSSFSLDVAAFYYLYDQVRTSGPLNLSPETLSVPVLVQWSKLINGLQGHSHGLEAAANWQVTPTWRLRGIASWLQLDMDPPGKDINDIPRLMIERGSPRQQYQLHSIHQLDANLDLTASVYYVDAIQALPSLDQSQLVRVPAYTRLDLSLGWRPTKQSEWRLNLQNLFDDRHPEFLSWDVAASQVPRSFLVQFRHRL